MNLNRNEEAKKEPAKLEWKDYVAITIAALQTVLLPVVILFMVILVFAVALGVLLFRQPRPRLLGVKVNSFMPFTSSQFYWAMMIAGIGESMIGETRTEPKIDHYASSG